MATYIAYTPTNVIAKAMFNFDASGIADYMLTGVVRVSVSDDFSFAENSLLYTSGPTEFVWTAQMTANIQDVMSIYSQFANITFQWNGDYDNGPPGFDSTPNPQDVGMANLSDININFVNRPDATGIAGISGGNGDSAFGFGYVGSAGDIFLNQAYLDTTTLDLGTYSRQALIHELGHSLGLSHPHTDPNNLLGSITADYAATKDLGFNQLGFRTSSAADMYKEYFTVMSYDQQPTVVHTPMILDVIALQQAYGEGAGTTGSGDDTISADRKSVV
jgi:serralysin